MRLDLLRFLRQTSDGESFLVALVLVCFDFFLQLQDVFVHQGDDVLVELAALDFVKAELLNVFFLVALNLFLALDQSHQLRFIDLRRLPLLLDRRSVVVPRLERILRQLISLVRVGIVLGVQVHLLLHSVLHLRRAQVMAAKV